MPSYALVPFNRRSEKNTQKKLETAKKNCQKTEQKVTASDYGERNKRS